MNIDIRWCLLRIDISNIIDWNAAILYRYQIVTVTYHFIYCSNLSKNYSSKLNIFSNFDFKKEFFEICASFSQFENVNIVFVVEFFSSYNRFFLYFVVNFFLNVSVIFCHGFFEARCVSIFLLFEDSKLPEIAKSYEQSKVWPIEPLESRFLKFFINMSRISWMFLTLS